MSVRKAESRYTPNGLPGQNTCLNGGSIISLNFFILCPLQAARFHTRGKQSSLPTGDLHWPGLEAGQAGMAERLGGQYSLPVSSHTWCPWLLWLLKGPRICQWNYWMKEWCPTCSFKTPQSFEFLRALPIFFQPVSRSYWIWLLLAVLHAAPTALWEMAEAGLSEVQQDAFSSTVERRSFISGKVFSPRADKE